ncbi:MAG: protein translocase SEC61 complex subunit gamma [Thermoplasmata archaeon]|nr:protein translocase SEC61 complex subunit gamma [Thermoplasmata archaeon]MCI4345021.1 protein translocase SEC61 complex subunit gamma [Thermoplasmata archaeon]
MAFLDRARHVQDQFDGRLRGVGHGKFGRILRMARKPAVDEYVKVLEVTWLGAVIIGTVGFIIYIFFTQAGPWLWNNVFSGL